MLILPIPQSQARAKRFVLGHPQALEWCDEQVRGLGPLDRCFDALFQVWRMTEYSQVALLDTDMVFDVDAESWSLTCDILLLTLLS